MRKGLRVFESKFLTGFCRCSREKVASMLASFPVEERDDMVEPDGRIHVTCEYCSRVYELEPAALVA